MARWSSLPGSARRPPSPPSRAGERWAWRGTRRTEGPFASPRPGPPSSPLLVAPPASSHGLGARHGWRAAGAAGLAAAGRGDDARPLCGHGSARGRSGVPARGGGGPRAASCAAEACRGAGASGRPARRRRPLRAPPPPGRAAARRRRAMSDPASLLSLPPLDRPPELLPLRRSSRLHPRAGELGAATAAAPRSSPTLSLCLSLSLSRRGRLAAAAAVGCEVVGRGGPVATVAA